LPERSEAIRGLIRDHLVSEEQDEVLAPTHVHLDHHNCLEVVIINGRSAQLRKIADQILSLRGVKHGKFVITTTDKDLQ
ncbi:MAG: nickel-responsive transcriptional regulator NikR, partial [Acidobacteria bacterium]|nr:nickel-responsive transcriptional regulator NikR [Acidobacteriota bacterium]